MDIYIQTKFLGFLYFRTRLLPRPNYPFLGYFYGLLDQWVAKSRPLEQALLTTLPQFLYALDPLNLTITP